MKHSHRSRRTPKESFEAGVRREIRSTTILLRVFVGIVVAYLVICGIWFLVHATEPTDQYEPGPYPEAPPGLMR
ncbi:MAG TPA: hypothetical protein VJP59_05985 [Gemmatimonadota bacterium]|nr:hypothetical protein [Gemmatimonadota bacterium]